MSDPRQAHATDTRQQAFNVINTQQWRDYLIGERRAALQKAAEIEKLLGMETTENKLRKEVKDLRAQLERLKR